MFAGHSIVLNRKIVPDCLQAEIRCSFTDKTLQGQGNLRKAFGHWLLLIRFLWMMDKVVEGTSSNLLLILKINESFIYYFLCFGASTSLDVWQFWLESNPFHIYLLYWTTQLFFCWTVYGHICPRSILSEIVFSGILSQFLDWSALFVSHIICPQSTARSPTGLISVKQMTSEFSR